MNKLAAVLLVLMVGSPTFVYAEHVNISQSDLATIISAQAVLASATHTSKAFKGLSRTNTQSVQVQGTGTGPNYKVEVLCSLDGITFTKPEVGGDLGTFTDQNPHVIPVTTPLCVEQKLLITELGGANTITITALGLSQ